MGKLGSPPPSLSYFDSMRLTVNGTMTCVMQQDAFIAWIERHTSDSPALKDKLASFDFVYQADRWAAMLAILEAGIPLKVD
jgi:hypothetical protein